MENLEGNAQKEYAKISEQISQVITHIREERKHEKDLTEILDEKRLNYLFNNVKFK